MSDRVVAARAPKGTHDVLWPESTRWESLLARFADQVERAGYGLAHTPIFEDVAVFRRGIGEGSDVVGKEMYEFEDRGGRTLALRPEGTAPMVRAWVQHRPPLPWKAWYATPAFRYEAPQAGRHRQHHQLGVEALGPSDPDLDVEVIGLADGLFRSLGLCEFTLRINSMGDDTCRPAYLALLTGYLAVRRDQLCDEHRDRLEVNPLRALDCKRDACRAATDGAPGFADHLCEPCAAHFARVREGLAARGIPESKLCVIENWADGSAIQPKAAAGSALRARLGLADRFIVCYSGNLGRAHEFDTLLGAAEALRRERTFIFLVIGSGAKMAALKEGVAARGLDNFRFLPYQRRDMLEDSLAAADVHLVSLLPALEGYVVPSKLYGILAAGRPLIFIGDGKGDVGRVIEQGQCGRTVTVGDCAGLRAALGEFAADPDGLLRLGARARRIFEQEYSLQRALSRWAALIEDA